MGRRYGRQGDIAQDHGARDHAHDQQDPAQRGAAQDQDAHPGDGIQAHPLAGQGQAQQDADHRQADQPGPAPAPPARPDRREQGVGGDDEQAHVDVVHGDPGLDEEHPVDRNQDPDEDRHGSSPEQDPGQQVQQERRQGAGDDPREAPRKGVAANVDRGDRAVGRSHQERLAI